MATKREMRAAIIKEYAMLRKAWAELYMRGSDEDQMYEVGQDMSHPAKAIGVMIHELNDEAVAQVNHLLAEGLTRGLIEPGEAAYDVAFNAYADMTKLLGVRMFRLGQHLATRLPYGSMTPCPCQVITDEEIHDLFTEPFTLEGEGWVIENFRPRREEDE